MDRKIKGYNKYKLMGCLAIIVLIAVISVFISQYMTKKQNPESLIEHYFSKSDETILNEFLYKDGTMIEIEDYVVTFDSMIYEPATGQGYCLFIINKIKGSFNKDSFRKTFDSRYALGINETTYTPMVRDYDVKINNGNAYLYYKFYKFEVSGELNENRIYLYDYNVNNKWLDPKEAIASFPFQTKTKYKWFILEDEMQIKISAFSINILGFPVSYESIRIHYKNGNFDAIYANGEKIYTIVSYYSEASGGAVGPITILNFKKPMDIDNIDYITADNVKYYCIEE